MYESSLMAIFMFGCLLAVVRTAPDWNPWADARPRRRRRVRVGEIFRTPTGRPTVIVAIDEATGRAFYIPVSWN